MATWTELDDELNRWAEAGIVADFWWRDDDAEAPGPELDRLLALAEAHGVPMHLSVIPVSGVPELGDRLARARDTWLLQHGFAHLNHEPAGARPSEVGVNRDLLAQLDDIAEGWRRLSDAGLPNLLPVFVPPWNRIAETTTAQLPALGFRMLSASLARASATPVPGLAQVNVHADPIRWKNGVEFRGEGKFLDCVVEHLADRREGRADAAEPTGVTTHHLQHDAEIWSFLETLTARLSAHPAVRWVRLADLVQAEETSW